MPRRAMGFREITNYKYQMTNNKQIPNNKTKNKTRNSGHFGHCLFGIVCDLWFGHWNLNTLKRFIPKFFLLTSLLTLLAAAAMAPSPALAAGGDLITAFGTNGVVRSQLGCCSGDFPATIMRAGSYLYVAGNQGWLGWRIEKRRLDTGALCTAANCGTEFGTGGSVTVDFGLYSDNDAIYTMASDGTNFYIAGQERTSNTNSRWRIEKRRLDTGALCTAANCGTGFGTGGSGSITTIDPSSYFETPTELVIYGSDLYITGNQCNGSDNQLTWRVEKRSSSTGALISGFGSGGVVTSNPRAVSSCGEPPYFPVIAVDSTGLYIAGMEDTATDSIMRIEKRSLSTAGLISGFGSGGVLQYNPAPASYDGFWTDAAYSIVADATALYIGSFHSFVPSIGGGGSFIEKRDLSTGALISSFGSGGGLSRLSGVSGVMAQADMTRNPQAITVDNTGVYVVGGGLVSGYSFPNNRSLYVEKKDLANGNEIFAVVGAIVFNSSRADVILADITAIYIAGVDGFLGSGDPSWRIELRESGVSGPPPPPTVTLTATPSTIITGEYSDLTWTSTDATSCAAVDPPGWTSQTGTSGTERVWPLATTTYTIECTGPGSPPTAQQSTTVTVGSGGSTWVEERITGAPGAERYPDISGNLIVWDDNRDPGGGILGCVYGGNCDGGLFGWQISPSSNWQSEPAISGSFVVWQELTATNWDIFIYDGISQTLQITNNSAAQWYPDVSGNRVVWEDARNGPGDIYSCVYNQATNTCPEQQITTNPAGQASPAISGNLVAWMDFRGGFNPNVYVYEVDTAQEVPITTGGVSWEGYPPAVSGNLIVWEASRNIYLCVYDSATNSCSAIKQITTDLSSQGVPAISGTRIVWEDGRNGNGDIYSCVYDQGTNTCPEEQVTTNLAHQRFPSIDGNKVVWIDLRNDTGMGNNFDIYLASPSGGGGGTPPTVTLTATPSTITSGEYSDLTWVTTDATSCNDVEPPDWLAGPVGGDPGGTQRIWPTATDTYTIECTGPGSPPTASDSVTVTVNPPPPPPPEGSCGNLVWGEIVNLAAYVTANDIALGSDGVYVVGDEGGGDKWRIEKRDFGGTAQWTQNFDNIPGSGSETAQDVAVDKTGVYIVGGNFLSGDSYQWRMEKRNLNNGTLLWEQTSNPNSTDSGNYNVADRAYGVAVDDTGVYIVGEQADADPQWRMEKRDLNNGSLSWVQTSDPDTSSSPYRQDRATAVAADGTAIYVVGWETTNWVVGPSVDTRWRIEKRDPVTGNLIWARTSKYGLANTMDRAQSVAIDSTGIYVAGWHYPPAGGNEDWRMEKWDFNGNQVWQRTYAGAGGGQDWAEAVAVDDTGVYVGGSIAVGNYSSHMRKLSLSDGSTLCSVTTGASFPQDPGEMTTVRGLAVNCRGVYWAGEYNSGVDITWTVALRQASNGLTACGLRVYDGSSVVPVCCEDPPLSPLRIQRGATTYGVNLVDPSAADATPVRIQTPSGIKALRRQ